jgi:hypothetical protein
MNEGEDDLTQNDNEKAQQSQYQRYPSVRSPGEYAKEMRFFEKERLRDQ